MNKKIQNDKQSITWGEIIRRQSLSTSKHFSAIVAERYNLGLDSHPSQITFKRPRDVSFASSRKSNQDDQDLSETNKTSEF